MASPTTGTRQSLRTPARRRRFLVVLAGSLLASWVAMAAVVSMHPPSGAGELQIPVMLHGDPDEYVSGLQFDLAYDPTQFELVGITAGDAATGAGKEVILSEVTPGQGRVLITGFNNNGMTDGQVATLTLRPLNGSAPQHDISLGQVLASDPDGNSIPIDYADLYQYPPAPPLEEEEVPVAIDTEAEPIDDSPAGSPDEEGTGGAGDPVDGESGVESGDGGTGTLSGRFGSGFAGFGDGGLNSTDGGEAAKTTNGGARSARNDRSSGATDRTSGLSVRTDRGGDAGFSRNDDPRSTSRPTHALNTPPTRDGVRPQRPDNSKEGGGLRAPQQNASVPTEMALLRPASGLVDPPSLGDAAYTLAPDAAEVKEEVSGTRSLIAALTLSLTVALLAIANLLFGRMSRPLWRKSR